MFVNTLPVRVQVNDAEPLTSWLQRLQERQLARQDFEHSPLTQIQRWSEVPAGSPLFETLYVFENYPTISSEGTDAASGSLRIAGLPHEAFMVIFLNVQNEIIGSDVVNEGTVDQVAVYPRRIIEGALARHAAGLILAHNHPSGHTEPSDEDRRLTDLIRTTARALDIRVLDHLVVGRGGFGSFAERGWL